MREDTVIMTMTKLLLVCLGIIFPIWMFAQDIVPRKAVVTGTLLHSESKDPKVVTVNFIDPLSLVRFPASIGSDGTFYAQADMCFAQDITISYNSQVFKLFIRPTDSVHIEIDMTKFREGDLSGLKFSGDCAAINRELVPLADYMTTVKMRDVDYQLKGKEFITEVKMSIDQLNDSLSAYSKRHHLSKFVTEWCRRDIVYSVANSLVWKLPSSEKASVFTDPIFDIHHADNFQSAMFQYHLINLLSPVLISDTTFRSCIKAGDMKGGSLVGIKLLSTKFPASTSRDFLQYMLLIEVVNTDPKLYADLPKGLFKNQLFDNKLKAIYEGSNRLEYKPLPLKGVWHLNSEEQITPLEEQDLFQYFAKRYPGKVLYLDVWSTSCNPCLMSFADAKKLHQLYNDDVVFINLCLNSKMAEWRQVLSEYSVDGENYYLDPDASALLMGHYGFRGYPTYLIIGKDGKLKTKNASQPSDLIKTKAAIDQYL